MCVKPRSLWACDWLMTFVRSFSLIFQFSPMVLRFRSPISDRKYANLSAICCKEVLDVTSKTSLQSIISRIIAEDTPIIADSSEMIADDWQWSVMDLVYFLYWNHWRNIGEASPNIDDQWVKMRRRCNKHMAVTAEESFFLDNYYYLQANKKYVNKFQIITSRSLSPASECSLYLPPILFGYIFALK